MASTLPQAAYSNEIVVTKIEPHNEGKNENRHVVGVRFRGLLLFDGCAHVSIVVRGLDPAKFPAPEVVTERNMKLDFLKVRFTDLVITFTAGDYGAIRYTGTASGAEIIQGK